ncbi:MAG: DUF2332 family protein [Myxococcales bacterium]|nr:DUF2332 family protein [Myxococcales bacterium]
MGSRSPSYQALLRELAKLLEGGQDAPALLAHLDRVWGRRTFQAYYERPLLLLASLRFDALRDGPTHPLWSALASDTPSSADVQQRTILEALRDDRLGLWTTLGTRRVQTNETSRAVVWLWPAQLAGCDNGERPVALVDVGASAGLNLVADQLPRVWRDSADVAVPTAHRPSVIARLGLEPRPLDVRREDDVRWLHACLWPGETDRRARLDAAIRAMLVAYKSGAGPAIERTNASTAAARIATLERTLPPDAVIFAYQTLVAGYLPPEEAEAYRDTMSALVESLPQGRVAWLEMELSENPKARLPANITAHVKGYAGRDALVLARCGFHPAEVAVRSDAASAFRAAIAARA